MFSDLLIRFAYIEDETFILENTELNSERIRIKINQQEIIIATLNGNNCGLLILDYLWSHIPFIANIWVIEEKRKLGVGKALVEFLQEYLINKGHKKLFSSSMESATKAQKWHKRIGFIECGIISDINGSEGEIFFIKKFQ